MYINKKLKAALDYLGHSYSIQTIDFEQCIYRNLNNGFDLEISGVKHPRKGNVCDNIWVWDNRQGQRTIERIRDIHSHEELKEVLDGLCEKWSGTPTYTEEDLDSWG